jgi:hypothetical protein
MGAFLTEAFNASAKIGLSSVLLLLALTGTFAQHVPARGNIIVIPVRRPRWRLSGS